MAGSEHEEAPVEASGELDAHIDALYAGPPEQFVAARTALAKELRRQKRRDEAAAVQRLARPALSAWAAGRTVATQPALFAALLEAGAALVAAQRRAVEQADGSGVRPALLQRRQAVAALVAATQRWLVAEGRAGGDGRGDELSALFEAASVDAEVARALARGRLVRTPEGATGFELLEGLQPASSAADRPARPTPRRPAAAVATSPADGLDPAEPTAPAPKRRRAQQRPTAEAAEATAAAEAKAAAEAEAAAARLAAVEALEQAERRLDQAAAAAADADRQTAASEQHVQDLLDALEAARLQADEHRAQRATAHVELDQATAARDHARRQLDALAPAPGPP